MENRLRVGSERAVGHGRSQAEKLKLDREAKGAAQVDGYDEERKG